MQDRPPYANTAAATDLPPPGADALTHSRALHEHIVRTITEAGGKIPFSRYMELALYAPAQGYYSAGAAKFGPDGDFTTAPEISALFGATIAEGLLPVLDELGRDAVLFEPGAGTGAMAASVLAHLARADRLPAEYLILEVSGDLRDRQRRALGALPSDVAGRVRWLDKLPEIPFEGVVLANEVLDALPVERFRVGEGGAADIAWVSVVDDTYQVTWEPPPPEVAAPLAQLLEQCRLAGASLAPGYTGEYCPGVAAFVMTLSYVLARGALVLSDYGGTRREVYLPERAEGTLLCHYRHRAHDNPFFLPGLQDITAWVDFTSVADAAVDAGLDLAGFAPQAHYLLGSGLDRALSAAMAAQPDRAAHFQSEIKTLTLPGEMGERFKFMGLTRGIKAPLSGFSLRDLSASLAMPS